jgi:hypothetical protein
MPGSVWHFYVFMYHTFIIYTLLHTIFSPSSCFSSSFLPILIQYPSQINKVLKYIYINPKDLFSYTLKYFNDFSLSFHTCVIYNYNWIDSLGTFQLFSSIAVWLQIMPYVILIPLHYCTLGRNTVLVWVGEYGMSVWRKYTLMLDTIFCIVTHTKDMKMLIKNEN